MSPQLEQWLLSHTKGLHIRTQYGNAVYTAMLVRLNGESYLLTAGHCLEELDKARKQGIRIEDANILPTDGTPAFSIIDIENTPLHYIYMDGIDIGLLPLRPWYESQLANEIFLEERHFTDLPTHYTGCMLIGFPAEFEQFNPTTIFVNPAYVSVSPVPKPEDLPETNPPRFFGTISPDIDFSIRGMSGGPIMGVLRDEQQNEARYWIVALQSGWLKERHMICATKLSACLPILLERMASNRA